jgi:hypothetical protein
MTAPLLQHDLTQLDLLLSVLERVEGLAAYERIRRNGIYPGRDLDFVTIADAASLALREIADELREQIA